MVEESGQSKLLETPQQPAAKKQKIPLEVQEQKLTPRPSIWPIALALALVITAAGLMIHPILFVCGIVITIAVIIGWIIEKH